jgi:hypothetical protein
MLFDAKKRRKYKNLQNFFKNEHETTFRDNNKQINLSSNDKKKKTVKLQFNFLSQLCKFATKDSNNNINIKINPTLLQNISTQSNFQNYIKHTIEAEKL